MSDTRSQSGTASVCSVIVTFNPDLLVLDRLITAVAQQVAAIVVVDNGSREEVTAWLGCKRRTGAIEAEFLTDNFGLAAAQNRGIFWAQRHGSTHVLLLDQDSIPAADMVANLLAAERDCLVRGERVAAVGPRFIDPDTGQETWFHGRGPLRFRYLKRSSEEGGLAVRADFLIASGMLIRQEVLAAVGGMDESLFIDLVDTEWCLRAAAAGYGIFGACAAGMLHSIGTRSVGIPGGGGRRGTFPVHPPLRYYYLFRNSMLLTLRTCIPCWWKRNNAMELLFIFLLISLIAERRIESLHMILKGLSAGLLGRSGRF